MIDEGKIKERIGELLALEGRSFDQALASKLHQGAISMLELTYGPKCSQIEALNDVVAGLQKSKEAGYRITAGIAAHCRGALENLNGNLNAGLVGNLRKEITGEVLGDFVGLAQAAVEQGTDEGKNVAAVLVAAAFEDTLRRLGAMYCNIYVRESLPEILNRLKAADVLKGSQIGVVQSHFQFRNDAMHADWNKLDIVGVKTVIALVQELLLKHFS
jgi:hypothetical protein